MTEIAFTAYTIPRGQPRVRAANIGGHVRMYTPTTASAFKASVGHAARESVLRSGTDGANIPWRESWDIEVVFYLPRPKRLCGKRAPRHAIRCACKPDLDNLLKATLDAIVDAGVVTDDRTLVSVVAAKFYTDIDESPRVEARINFWNTEGQG